MEKQHSNGRRQFWLGMLISVLCLVGIFFFISPAQIFEALKSANYAYLLLTALGIVGFLVVRAVRWRFMLSNDAPWITVFHIQNIGYLLSVLLPLRLGDVARAVLIGSVPPITISRGVSTMVVERILDMLFIVTLLPFTLSIVHQLPPWMQAGAQGFGFIGIAAMLVLIVAANQRPFTLRISTTILNLIPFMNTEAWVGRVESLLTGLDSLTSIKDGLVLILLTVLTWLPIIFAYYATLLAVNIEPTFLMAAFVVCAAAFSVALPSSPGQVGVFHAGVIAALQLLGQPEGASASFAFLYHAVNIAVMVGFGIIGILSTGSTFREVIDSAQAFLNRKQNDEQVRQ